MVLRSVRFAAFSGCGMVALRREARRDEAFPLAGPDEHPDLVLGTRPEFPRNSQGPFVLHRSAAHSGAFFAWNRLVVCPDGRAKAEGASMVTFRLWSRFHDANAWNAGPKLFHRNGAKRPRKRDLWTGTPSGTTPRSNHLGINESEESSEPTDRDWSDVGFDRSCKLENLFLGSE